MTLRYAHGRRFATATLAQQAHRAPVARNLKSIGERLFEA
jgi:hypothetical protein